MLRIFDACFFSCPRVRISECNTCHAVTFIDCRYTQPELMGSCSLQVGLYFHLSGR
jgi:hypothetical protein